MARPVHFEIQVNDVERAKNFYAEVLGWEFQDYSHVTGTPYWGVITGEEGTMGINGGLLPRTRTETPKFDAPNAFVVTVAVEDYDSIEEAILRLGGETVSPKTALPGMAWQGYFTDTEGNVFGIHQPDENAR
ncbi:VOC family protein [Propioniciclava flava]|uniref:Glyoxalase n=1 Tax=Propioniciclava flava TaxID=2072026 RepID=A0A4Q2EE07_9ACTN|nr:VOC family protein [Propioniciclava flava]RXW31153.1 glyoxalase [Propioniciclava flava]